MPILWVVDCLELEYYFIYEEDILWRAVQEAYDCLLHS